ncbi:MAG: hypothetical protein ACFFBD_29435 [Candidatus Hodarchaeota archaeon]
MWADESSKDEGLEDLLEKLEDEEGKSKKERITILTDSEKDTRSLERKNKPIPQNNEEDEGDEEDEEKDPFPPGLVQAIRIVQTEFGILEDEELGWEEEN